MINFNVHTNFTKASVAKQIPFALSRTMNLVANAGQQDILRAVPGQYTVRGTWLKAGAKFGIKRRLSSKTNLQTTLGTDANWLEEPESGGTRVGTKGHRLALPVIGSEVRPTFGTKRSRATTPLKLIADNKGFKLGDVIYMFKKGTPKAVRDAILVDVWNRAKSAKRGSGSGRKRRGDAPFEPAYFLDKTRKFQQRKGVIVPGVTSFMRNFPGTFAKEMANAMETAKR